jgi:hypothetical protein
MLSESHVEFNSFIAGSAKPTVSVTRNAPLSFVDSTGFGVSQTHQKSANYSDGSNRQVQYRSNSE